MKTLFAFVLLAFLGLAVLSCSDTSNPIVTNVDKASTISTAGSLDKGDGILHSATGSGHWKIIGWDDFVFEENVRFSFSAIMKADGSCSGAIQFRDKGPLYEAHGKVDNIKVSDNIAKVSIHFTRGNFGQYYDPPVDITTMFGWFIAIDNGEGNSSNGKDMLSMILWTDGSDIGEQTIDGIEAMSPEDFLAMMHDYLLPTYGIPYDAYLAPIDNGSIQVR